MRTNLIIFALLFMLLAAVFLSGCEESSSDGSQTSSAVPTYGGSVPKGDYTTINVSDDGLTYTITNYTNSTYFGATGEKTLTVRAKSTNFYGFSFIKNATDNANNSYYIVEREDEVLALQKMANSTSADGLPIFAFAKDDLEIEDFPDRTFSFLQFKAGGNNTSSNTNASTFEAGAIGFDTDADGTLYGGAYNSEVNATYSITDDGITTATLKKFDDGSLVMWEDQVENWASANTFTGTKAGPLVIDFGPKNGGGAGFAIKQADFNATNASEWWDTVSGDYLLMEYDSEDDSVSYSHLNVKADSAWNGTVTAQEIVNPGNSTSTIVPLHKSLAAQNATDEFAKYFKNATSSKIQKAHEANGVFQLHNGTDYEPTFIGFDPSGNYLAYGSDDGIQITFGIAVKDDDYSSAP